MDFSSLVNEEVVLYETIDCGPVVEQRTPSIGMVQPLLAGVHLKLLGQDLRCELRLWVTE